MHKSPPKQAVNERFYQHRLWNISLRLYNYICDIFIQQFSLMKMELRMPYAKCRPFCLRFFQRGSRLKSSLLPQIWEMSGLNSMRDFKTKMLHHNWLNISLRWRHNGCNGVSNHQPHDCLLNRLFRCRLKKTPKLRVTGLYVRNSPRTGEFPTQMASNAENVSIWWRHHVLF